MIRLVLFVSLLLSAYNASAQNRLLLDGIITNALNEDPVAAAHVMNLTDSLATISSPEGVFKIPAKVGDSIIVSSIGYNHKALIISEELLLKGFVQLKMTPRDYQLEEVEVNPFGTKDQFRERFMELEVDDGVVDVVGVKGPSKDRRTIPVTEDADEIKKAKYMMSPASFLYGNLSKDAKARQELHKLEKEREKYKYNYQKFNEKTVARVTGYEGEKLYEFMKFCNLSEEQIYRYSEYQLTVIILNKQKSFETQR